MDSFVSVRYVMSKEPPKLDTLFERAVKLAISNKYASASMIHRELGTGFVESAKLFDELVKAGVVTMWDKRTGSRARFSSFDDFIKEYENA